MSDLPLKAIATSRLSTQRLRPRQFPTRSSLFTHTSPSSLSPRRQDYIRRAPPHVRPRRRPRRACRGTTSGHLVPTRCICKMVRQRCHPNHGCTTFKGARASGLTSKGDRRPAATCADATSGAPGTHAHASVIFQGCRPCSTPIPYYRRRQPPQRQPTSCSPHTFLTPNASADLTTGAPAPIASRTRSRTALANTVTLVRTARRIFPQEFLTMCEMLVLDHKTGEYLTYRQLCKHPRLASIWSISYSNKMGRLRQGIV